MSRTWVIVALLLLAPLASAGSAPVVGFFADGPDGAVAEGAIELEMPETNESKVRIVTADLAGTATSFVGNESIRAGTHLRGPLFVGLWPDASAVYEGQLEVRVVVDGETLAQKSVDVSADPDSLPEPTGLVPPDPADPEGAILHAMGQVLPAVLEPPLVYNMGSIDLEIPEGSDIRVELRLVNADGAPPLGASTLIKYDGKLTPSFVYLPWWSADPQAEPPQKQQIEEASGSGGSSSSSTSASTTAPAGGMTGDEGEGGGKDSPGIAIVLVAVVVAGLAIYRRR